jgi:hypothetical protein
MTLTIKTMPKKESPFYLPKVILCDAKPILEIDGELFVSNLHVQFRDARLVTAYDNKGLRLADQVGSYFECLLEITRGEVFYQKEKATADAIEASYLWSHLGYVLFPELVKIREEMEEAYINEEAALELLYEERATEAFSKWGLAGLGLDIYQFKPMLSTQYGVLLINEYQFEEDIDHWELNDQVWVQPEEVFLRGLRQVEKPSNWKESSEVESTVSIQLLD